MNLLSQRLQLYFLLSTHFFDRNGEGDTASRLYMFNQVRKCFFRIDSVHFA